MTEAALAELGRGPTVSLMTRRRASAPPAPPTPDAVSASSASQTKQRSKSAANSENASGGSDAATAAAGAGGGTPAVHQNHPEGLCRYPNKRCYNKRAVKNNGELHKFCDTHRDSANRYQRKLEQRLKEKRIQSRMRALLAQQAQAQAQARAQAQAQDQMIAQGHTSALMGTSSAMMVSPYPGMEVYGGAVVSGTIVPVTSTMVPPVSFPGHPAAVASSGDTPTRLWTQGEDEYEPFHHPVELQSEDLDCLDLLFEE
ncbi:hypothetical protein PHYPSEUDO_002748 [Phytophthora pseudosyringae]|uniref:SBP-type domain-containing protein n=1 Tax=Phytophthora pseudosyringae TaxID=221518 RepID=A0A8T1VT47_9STRA|nr:hypothetical protein PHYPSEUDO_002748 [Phytophthora pseudosyringae]